ncbi:MAG: HDOD domain-containing protein [Tissierellales bacterium]
MARQPIFRSDQDVCAYEILYRSGAINEFDGSDGDKASTEVIFNTFQTFGIESLTYGKPVFINFTESLINEEVATLFSRDFLVVEILENVIPKVAIIENSKSLKEMGYKIALDDFVYGPEYDELIELADIIKIDFLNSSRQEIENVIKKIKDKEIVLLAEKVETREDFEYAKSLGFTLFQGYFFSKPEILTSKKLHPVKSTCLQLINEINGGDIDFKRISNIISRDLSLTYNLLKLVNSGAFGFRYRIKSVIHAVTALGEREIKKWIYLIVLSDMGQEKPDELTKLSLIRAKFAERLARKTRFARQADDVFLLGLFSLLDVILNRPLKEVLNDIQATEMVRQALLDKEGEMGNIYKMMLSYEKGEWDKAMEYAEELGISYSLLLNAYMEALIWYRKLIEIKAND